MPQDPEANVTTIREMETVQPVKKAREKKERDKRTFFTDTALKVTGLTLAGLSAFFPWYVFLNPDKFGIHADDGDRTRPLPNWPARNVFSVSPMAMINSAPADSKPQDPDDLTTASTNGAGPTDLKGADAENQPFPSSSSFRLLHVSNGRALIEDAAGMYVVKVGSILPDNSRLSGLEEHNGKWVMVTSNGVVAAQN
jgi:hypothetical protein